MPPPIHESGAGTVIEVQCTSSVCLKVDGGVDLSDKHGFQYWKSSLIRGSAKYGCVSGHVMSGEWCVMFCFSVGFWTARLKVHSYAAAQGGGRETDVATFW